MHTHTHTQIHGPANADKGLLPATSTHGQLQSHRLLRELPTPGRTVQPGHRELPGSHSQDKQLWIPRRRPGTDHISSKLRYMWIYIYRTEVGLCLHYNVNVTKHAMPYTCNIHVAVLGIGNKHYSVAYSDRVSAFIALYLRTGGPHTRYIHVHVEASICEALYAARTRMSPTFNRSLEIQRFERRDTFEIRTGIMFVFYPGLPHMYSF